MQACRSFVPLTQGGSPNQALQLTCVCAAGAGLTDYVREGPPIHARTHGAGAAARVECGRVSFACGHFLSSDPLPGTLECPASRSHHAGGSGDGAASSATTSSFAGSDASSESEAAAERSRAVACGAAAAQGAGRRSRQAVLSWQGTSLVQVSMAIVRSLSAAVHAQHMGRCTLGKQSSQHPAGADGAHPALPAKRIRASDGRADHVCRLSKSAVSTRTLTTQEACWELCSTSTGSVCGLATVASAHCLTDMHQYSLRDVPGQPEAVQTLGYPITAWTITVQGPAEGRASSGVHAGVSQHALWPEEQPWAAPGGLCRDGSALTTLPCTRFACQLRGTVPTQV